MNTRSMETIYLSPVHTGSWGSLFHEIPCMFNQLIVIYKDLVYWVWVVWVFCYSIWFPRIGGNVPFKLRKCWKSNYSLFHIKGFGVYTRSMETFYLSLVHTGSWGYLFHDKYFFRLFYAYTNRTGIVLNGQFYFF